MLIDAIIGHLVGAFLLQNDLLALNKKKSTLICAIHCGIWTACVCAFGGLGWLAAVILFATHFTQDRTNVVTWWMDLIDQKQFRTGACAPWSAIVVDQSWHIVTIWAVVRFL
jgi:hypothetical protein